jgi:phage baseplate assembly protein W
MAIIIRNKFPVDTQAQKAVGVDLPFSAPAVFKSNYFTRDAIKYNLINFYSTKRGERVMNPLFGSRLQNLVFNNITEITDDSIRAIITDETNNYFPFVTLADINIQKQEDNNQYIITITYQVANFGINDTITVTI